MFERARGFFRIQRFQDNHVLFRRQVVEQIGNIFRHPIVDDFAQRLTIVALNEFPNFR